MNEEKLKKKILIMSGLRIPVMFKNICRNQLNLL